MLDRPRVAAKVCRWVLTSDPKTLRRIQSTPLDALLPAFLCPAIEQRASTRPAAGPSSSSPSLASSPRTRPGSGSKAVRVARYSSSNLLSATYRSFSSTASHSAGLNNAHDAENVLSSGRQTQLWRRNQHAALSQSESSRRSKPSSSKASAAFSDWRRKFPSTSWGREMDFNRYSPPLRQRHLPEDAPALYEDELKASAAWLPDSQWTLDVPDDYPLRHELFLALDSLDGIAKSSSEPDSADLLTETLRHAKEVFWSTQNHTLRRTQDRNVALYLAGKVAETYVKLDAEATLDRLISFLEYTRAQIGVLPLPCYHALAAKAGITRRYDAVLKICQVAQQHHAGKTDAELLHLRLRALIAQDRNVALTRYWKLFAEASAAVPRKTFDLLLRTHVRRQDVEQLNEVLREMPQHGHEVDARAWLTILRGFQSFRPTLAAMLRRDAKIVQKPTLNVVNELLLLLSKELDVDGAIMVLRIFRIPSIPEFGGSNAVSTQDGNFPLIDGPSPEPTAQTYAILTIMLGRLGRAHEALSFFRLAVSASSEKGEDDSSEKALQQASASVMMASLNEGHPHHAMTFAAKMFGLPFFGSAKSEVTSLSALNLPTLSHTKITASSLHYRILLECASALWSVDSARRIIVHFLLQGHKIDQEVLHGLARLIFSTIDQGELETIRVIRRLLPHGSNAFFSKRKQGLMSLSALLQQLGVSERVALASQHTTDLDRKLDDAEAQSGKNISGDGGHDPGMRTTSPTEELRDWLIKDISSPFTLDTRKVTDVDGSALSQDLRRPLTPMAYAMRIRVYAVVRRDYESAQKVYHAMLQHSIRPTMMHVAPLIEGLTALGRLEDAQRLKHNAKEVTGFEPTLRIHTALIRAYVRAGNPKAARDEIQELTSNGLRIDDTIANIIEAAQAKREAYSLVDRPVNRKDAHSVATRFHALMRMRRYLAAQELLQSAMDSGMRSDKVLHDLVRRSVSYVQKQHTRALAAARTSGSAHPKTMPREEQQSLSSDKGLIRLHILELAQAVRLAKQNQERMSYLMQRGSEFRRKMMKQYRTKMVTLILDFADGKLHRYARLSRKRLRKRESTGAV